MPPTLRTPEERSCELCGRVETWDEATDAWRVVSVDDEPQVGSLHCIHEWNINGSFVPFDDAREAIDG